MVVNRKHRIKKLNRKIKFGEAAELIVDSRLTKTFKMIKKYQGDESEKNLHALRIAIRRLRYVLELFYQCFEKKSYKYLYTYLKEMQDTLGAIRDLDVLAEKVKSLAAETDIQINPLFYNKIDAEKNERRELIRAELITFAQDKKVNKFLTKQREQ